VQQSNRQVEDSSAKTKTKASINEYKKELCTKFLTEGLMESYYEMLKICYYEDFKTKGIIKNDESHHLTLIRIK
jgi:hypothetical protein